MHFYVSPFFFFFFPFGFLFFFHSTLKVHFPNDLWMEAWPFKGTSKQNAVAGLNTFISQALM
jgi:hypothetical protein